MSKATGTASTSKASQSSQAVAKGKAAVSSLQTPPGKDQQGNDACSDDLKQIKHFAEIASRFFQVVGEVMTFVQDCRTPAVETATDGNHVTFGEKSSNRLACLIEETEDSLTEMSQKTPACCDDRFQTASVSKEVTSWKLHVSLRDAIVSMKNLTQEFIIFREDVFQTVKDLCKTESKQCRDYRNLEADFLATQEEDKLLRTENAQLKAELTSSKATTKRQQVLLDEKQAEINALRRQATVELWEKERSKVLSEAEERIQQLTDENKGLRDDHAAVKGRMQRRLDAMIEEKRLIELKQEIHKKYHLDGASLTPDDEVTRLERLNYLLHKDVLSIETEFYKYQKLCAGILHGISRDFKHLADRLCPIDAESKIDSLSQKLVKQLRLLLMQVYTQMCHGSKLDFLPDIYTYTDREVKPIRLRKLYTAYTRNRLRENRKIDAKMLELIEEAEEYLDSEETNEDGDGGTRQKGRRPTQADLDFVHFDTGQLHITAVLKNFPRLAENYIKKQWKNFCKYDTNKDFMLDLFEVMGAMTATLGEEFTATQIQEAMAEVDSDQSTTIDFYEYLNIANLLVNKRGRADIFRSREVQEQNKVLSKTCAIQ